MFYSRNDSKLPLLRHLVMFLVAFGLAIFFLATDATYDRAGVMLIAALLCGGFFLWQALQFDRPDAVKEEVLQSLRDVWS